jgi:hypothetical protein
VSVSVQSAVARTIPFRSTASLSNISWIWLAGFPLIAGTLAIIWAPIAPTRLFDFDSANFALSLDNFNPALHQPQPPGYPLYVGLCRLIHFFIPDPVLVFLMAGILGAAAAVVMLERLGEQIFGRAAGICAGLLLMTNPILWKAGMTDQVRVYLAVISTGVALALWPEWGRPLKHSRFVWACLILGVVAGFRPETIFSLAPLLVIAGTRARLNLHQWTVGAIALCAGVAPWLYVLIKSMGGFPIFADVMHRYAYDQAGGSSLVLGAQSSAALKMFVTALWWLSLGLAAWMPALFFRPWRMVSGRENGGIAFLFSWFLPQFLLSVAVHIAAPGHALGFLPVLCLAGGWALSNLSKTRNRAAMVTLTALALVLNVVFFFRPYSKVTKEASYKIVGFVANVIDTTLDRVDMLSDHANVYLINYDGWVAWRILQYYYPSTPFLQLPGRGNTRDPVWLISGRRLSRETPQGREIELPACGTLIWFVTDDQSRHDLLAVEGAEDQRYFVMTFANPGTRFLLGRHRLKTSSQPCIAR